MPKRRFQSMTCASVVLCLSVTSFGQCAGKPKAPSSAETRPRQKEKVKTMDQEVFLNAPLNSYERNACSPKKPDDPAWRGILIQAPERVVFKPGVKVGEHGAFAAIPVCGVYMADVPFPIVEDVLKLVATDKRTGKTYSGPIIELDTSPQVPPPAAPPLTKKDVEGMASGKYFNPNLADYVRLPASPAIYDVYVELRGIRSNTVTIEVTDKEPDKQPDKE